MEEQLHPFMYLHGVYGDFTHFTGNNSTYIIVIKAMSLTK
jgi:hypothetical protein